jgi:hypothetical protein
VLAEVKESSSWTEKMKQARFKNVKRNFEAMYSPNVSYVRKFTKTKLDKIEMIFEQGR